jgi:DNA-binding transcriptional LysR family regulator
MADPDWHLYRSFLAVLRLGSLSAAARKLRLTQPTLGRHVETLERDLGVALFTRSPGGLAPTAQALALLARAEDVEAAATALVRAAEGAKAAVQGLSGTVRITASESMGAEVLPPLLVPVRAAHPALKFELVLTNRTQNLLRRDADIAVRMVRPRQAALLARKLGHVSIGLFAHRDYARSRGLPENTAQLGEFDVIGFDRDDNSVRAISPDSPWADRGFFGFRTDSDLAQMAAVRAGLGIGAMQHKIAARDAKLVPVLAKAVHFDLELWLAMHEDQRANASVRAVYDALAQGLAAWAAAPTNVLVRRGRAR